MALNKENMSTPSNRLVKQSSYGSPVYSLVSRASSNKNVLTSNAKSPQNSEFPAQTKKELKEAFHKFESHSLTKEQFKKVIENNIGVKPTPEFEKKIAKVDVKFKDIVQTLKVNSPRCDEISVKSTVNPLAGSHHRYKKPSNTVDTSTASRNEDSIVEKVSGLLDGKIAPREFMNQLKEKGVDTKTIEKDIKHFESTKNGSFTQIGGKIMKELNYSGNLNLPQSPTRSSRFVLETNSSILRSAKSASPCKRIDDQKIDANQIDTQNRLFQQNGKYITNPRKGVPRIEVVASKANGDIISWKKSHVIDYEKPQGIKKLTTPRDYYDGETPKSSGIKRVTSHRDKITSLDLNMAPISTTNNVNYKDITPLAGKGKNIKMHMSSVDFFKWN